MQERTLTTHAEKACSLFVEGQGLSERLLLHGKPTHLGRRQVSTKELAS